MITMVPLDRLSDDDLEDLLDSDSITPAIAKKIEDLLARRHQQRHPDKEPKRTRVEEEE